MGSALTLALNEATALARSYERDRKPKSVTFRRLRAFARALGSFGTGTAMAPDARGAALCGKQ